jgi:hypothetical protein
MILAIVTSLRHLLGWVVSAFRSRADLSLENLALRQQLLAIPPSAPITPEYLSASIHLLIIILRQQRHAGPDCLSYRKRKDIERKTSLWAAGAGSFLQRLHKAGITESRSGVSMVTADDRCGK